jgi:hypothetical protein
VKIIQFSLTGPDRPRYTYEAEFFPRGVHPARIEANLSAKQAVKLRGDFVAADPQRSLAGVQDVLERDRFFEMRLSPTDTRYLDGPEDVVTVVRCGVTTTLSTIPQGGEVGLDDVQAKAFFSLENDLRNVIFSQTWMPPMPSPTP